MIDTLLDGLGTVVDFVFDHLWTKILLGLFVLTAIGFLFYNAYRNERKWAAFVVDHHCNEIRRTEDTWIPITTVGAKGEVSVSTMYVAGNKTYKCDDGREYTR